MAKGKGIGQALYVEMRKPNYTNQHVFFPERWDNEKRDFMQAILLTRQVSKVKPKAGWRQRIEPVVMGHRTLDPATGLIKADLPKDAAYDAAIAVYEAYKLHFDAALTGGWKLYKTPLVVEFTTADLSDLDMTKTPEAFLLRVDKARIEAGYDKAYWSEEV